MNDVDADATPNADPSAAEVPPPAAEVPPPAAEVPPPAAEAPPPAAEAPPPVAEPAWDSAQHAPASDPLQERPELAVGAVFVGGLLLARLLRRFGRR
ncbi:MAG TPA: hypothetical protein VHE14_00570 [Solirubrobacteraceae bacterium]|nr:hypothetical protein [Solirubrobacteraceae bacterium]